MKILAKSVAVAAIAMSVTSVAEARIQSMNDITPDGSELILNMVNYTAKNSYTQDLGVTIGQFFANPSQLLSFSLDNPNFQLFTAAYTPGDNVAWGVFGGHGVMEQLSDLPIYGFYTTSVENPPRNIDENLADISNTMGKWHDMVTYIQGLGSNSINESHFRTSTQFGYTGRYYNDFQTALPFTAQGPLGMELTFVHEKVNAEDYDTGELEIFPNVWRLDMANASLTYAPVPLPGAVWMFGAALLGMVGINRRKAVA